MRGSPVIPVHREFRTMEINKLKISTISTEFKGEKCIREKAELMHPIGPQQFLYISWFKRDVQGSLLLKDYFGSWIRGRDMD